MAVKPHDDHMHSNTGEANFNESMYFNFFDNAKRLGGFLRIGNRANERYAEVTLTLYQPDGTVLFNYKRPEITHNDAFDAGGMRFETVEPLVKLRTTYDGSAVFLAHPEQMSDPGQAFRQNPHNKVSINLTHEAVGPVYGSSGEGRQTADPRRSSRRPTTSSICTSPASSASMKRRTTSTATACGTTPGARATGRT